MKKLYVDFDNTIVDTVGKIVSLYNEDHKYYRWFEPVRACDINTYDFQELKLESFEEISKYFNQPRFFENLEWMDNAEEVLEELSKQYEIKVVSIGTYENLVGKGLWILKNMPYADFQPILVNAHESKRFKDMRDGYLIDDKYDNLTGHNTYKSICFGDVYSWNEQWTGVRCHNWYDVKRFLREEDSRSD